MLLVYSVDIWSFNFVAPRIQFVKDVGLALLIFYLWYAQAETELSMLIEISIFAIFNGWIVPANNAFARKTDLCNGIVSGLFNTRNLRNATILKR